MFLFARRKPPSRGSSGAPTPQASPVPSRGSGRSNLSRAASSPHLRHPPSFGSLETLAFDQDLTPVPKSVTVRVLLLLVAGFHVFLTAGVVFGWTSLAQVLAKRGVGCDGDNCSGQAGIFAFIFTLGTIGNYTSNLPFGLLLDTRGPQACCVLAALVQLTGALAMYAHAAGFRGESLVPAYIGFFLLGFGGPGVQKATFHMAHLFPSASGSLIAASTALFDGGSVIFALFYSLTDAGSLDLETCWLGYAGAVLLVLASGAVLWPSAPFEPPPDTDVDAVFGNPDDDTATALSKRSLKRQLRSPPYLYLVLFASVHVCRLNFAVATFQEQVGSLGFGASEVDQFVVIFGRLLPLGFVGMPLIGYLLDNSTPLVVFLLVNAAGVLNSSLLLVPHSRPALLGAMCCVAVGRQFVYSTFFSELQRLASPRTYGTLAGSSPCPRIRMPRVCADLMPAAHCPPRAARFELTARTATAPPLPLGLANLCVAATGLLLSPLSSLSTSTLAPWGEYAFAPANLLMMLLVLLLFTQPLSCWREARRARTSDGPTFVAVARGAPSPLAPASVLERGAPNSSLRVSLLTEPQAPP